MSLRGVQIYVNASERRAKVYILDLGLSTSNASCNKSKVRKLLKKFRKLNSDDK